MVSAAIVQLGLTKVEFFELLPVEFAALMGQHKNRIRHTELLHAIVAKTMVDVMVSSEKPVPYSAFMPSEWAVEEAKKPKRKRITKGEREFINSKIRSFMLARVVRVQDSPE